MPEFVIRLSTPLDAAVAFDRLVDWDRHSAAIPLTTLTYEGVARVGQRFVARTAVGPLGFDDVMVVELLRRPTGELPGVVEVSKHGRVLGGTVHWTVTPTPGGSEIEWRQQLVVRWLPRLLDPLVAAIGKVAYGMGVRRLLGTPSHR